MPKAAKNYSITELEMFSLAINIASFAHLLKRVEYCCCSQSSGYNPHNEEQNGTSYQQNKETVRNLKFLFFQSVLHQGKDMILSDFLLRQIEDDSNPHEIIPISFNIWDMLQDNYHQLTMDTYNVQTRAQAKVQANNPTMPDIPPEKREQKATPKVTRLPIQAEEKDKELKIPSSKIALQTSRNIGLPPNFMLPPRVVSPNNRLPPKPPDIGETDPHQEPDPRMDIEENSPYQEGIITEAYVAPDRSYLEQPQELVRLVNTSKFVQRHLPWQADIDKILNVIKRKVLKGTHLPITIKEIQAGYLNSPFFKDLYRYLVQNIMPSKSHARQKVEMLAESFILLENYLLILSIV